MTTPCVAFIPVFTGDSVKNDSGFLAVGQGELRSVT